jgi:hypothetical protein
MNKKNERSVGYRVMSILALSVGVISLGLQLMPGWETLTFMLSVAALGGLIGGRSGYAEQDRQQLDRSYKTAFEGLLLSVMAAYALVVAARGIFIIQGAAVFVNSHWPGLVISAMCALMGIAGFQRGPSESR